jgi:hypothetical protein
MTEQSTRREFLEKVSAAGAVLGGVACAGPAVVWWIFAVASKRPELQVDPSGDRLRIADRVFLFK